MAPSLQLGESRLPDLCRRAGISQSELAKRLGVTRQFIYKVNKRERNLTLAQGIHASIILNCDVKDIHVLNWVNR